MNNQLFILGGIFTAMFSLMLIVRRTRMTAIRAST